MPNRVDDDVAVVVLYDVFKFWHFSFAVSDQVNDSFVVGPFTVLLSFPLIFLCPLLIDVVFHLNCIPTWRHRTKGARVAGEFVDARLLEWNWFLLSFVYWMHLRKTITRKFVRHHLSRIIIIIITTLINGCLTPFVFPSCCNLWLLLLHLLRHYPHHCLLLWFLFIATLVWMIPMRCYLHRIPS